MEKEEEETTAELLARFDLLLAVSNVGGERRRTARFRSEARGG